MWFYLAEILVAGLNAAIFAKYIQSTVESKALSAAAYDLLIMLSASAIYQLWAIMHQDFKVLIIGDVSSAIGTYLYLKFTNTDRK